MYTLAVKTHIDSAHYLLNYDGKCSKMHGHRWEITVFLQNEELNDAGMVIDFKLVKSRLESVCPDHTILNDFIKNPTAEHLAHWIFDIMVSYFNKDVTVVAVTVQETPECSATYSVK
jgi:6-pyruvoyltetrahydropterin/6-carboxytetrahydropterin synthase